MRMTVADLIVEKLKHVVGPDYTPRELATVTGLNPNSVRRATKELARSGAIVQSGTYRGAPTYALLENTEGIADETEYASGL